MNLFKCPLVSYLNTFLNKKLCQWVGVSFRQFIAFSFNRTGSKRSYMQKSLLVYETKDEFKPPLHINHKFI